jgi:O-antigen ligase
MNISKKRVLLFLLGVAVSMVMFIPAFSLGGFPLGYMAIITILLFSLFKRKLQNPFVRYPLLLVWILPITYVLVYSAISQSPNFIQVAARSSMPMLCVLVMVIHIHKEEEFMWFMLGMLPLGTLNAFVALGQYFNYSKIVNFGLIFIDEKQLNLWEVTEGRARVWGIMLRSHIFAYAQALWTFIGFWTLLIFKKDLKWNIFSLLLIGVFIMSCMSVYASGQRTAIWVLFPALLLLFAMTKGINKTVIVLFAAIVIVFFIDVSEFTHRQAFTSRVMALPSFGSEDARIESWRIAWDVISNAPFFGDISAYDHYIGIHNGFLGGWVHFGIFWFLLVVNAYLQTIKYVLQKQNKYFWIRVAGMLLILMCIANTMFHSAIPTLNDMPFLIAVGFMIILLNLKRNTCIT